MAIERARNLGGRAQSMRWPCWKCLSGPQFVSRQPWGVSRFQRGDVITSHGSDASRFQCHNRVNQVGLTTIVDALVRAQPSDSKKIAFEELN